ncbi:MAG TPA: iron-sulfur cluster repair di-iron protein [Flavitalea sp.]|nr:iron-sulfur cluster repair di-iron protein [Flavitalea sp.]
MTTLYSKSLAQIVNENHKTAYVFEKYHLDFCCKGKRLLRQACEEIRVPVEQVIADLENVTGDSKISVDFDKMSLTQLAEYIVLTHHDYVKRELPLIYSYLQKVASRHGDRHPELLAVLNAFLELQEDMIQHMEKEEIILFPRIRMIELYSHDNSEVQLNRLYLESPITVMEQEHENAGDLLSQMRELTNNYSLPADACTTYKLCFAALKAFEMDLHQHIHLENNILFPKTIKLFNTLNEIFLN